MFKKAIFLISCLAICSLYANEMDQPSTKSSQVGRYQLSVTATRYHPHVYIIDTELGIVWEKEDDHWKILSALPSSEWFTFPNNGRQG